VAEQHLELPRQGERRGVAAARQVGLAEIPDARVDRRLLEIVHVHAAPSP
jgi:hypothetical protein